VPTPPVMLLIEMALFELRLAETPSRPPISPMASYSASASESGRSFALLPGVVVELFEVARPKSPRRI